MGRRFFVNRLFSITAIIPIFFCGMVLCQDAVIPHDDETPKIDDAREAWKHIYAEYRKGAFVEMKWDSVAQFGEKKSEESTVIFETSLRGDFQWVKDKEQIPVRPNILGGWNERYRFFLEEGKDSGPYQIRGVDIKSSSDDSGWMNLMYAFIVLFDGLHICDTWIEKVVADPTFHVLTASYTSDPDTGQRLAEFTFQSDCQVSESETERMVGGRIVLVPECYWMVKEYQVDIESVGSAKESKGVLKKDVTYQMVDGIPFPETVESSFVLPDGTPNGVARRARLTKVTRQPIPKEQFYLSYYGFAEPTAVSADHLYRYIAIAVACFLIGLGLYLRHRQRAGRQTT